MMKVYGVKVSLWDLILIYFKINHVSQLPKREFEYIPKGGE